MSNLVLEAYISYIQKLKLQNIPKSAPKIWGKKTVFITFVPGVSSGIHVAATRHLSQEIFQVYDALSKVPNGFFTIAAAFGNVHGVYQPGNVKLEPTILDKASGDGAGGYV